MSSRINLPAVVVAAVAHFFLGAVWFTVFAEPWLKGIGKTREQLMAEFGGRQPIGPYLTSFVCNLILAYVLAWLIEAAGRHSLKGALLVALAAGVGFVGTTTLTEYAFEARSHMAFAINAGYPMVGMLLMGAILGGWPARSDQATRAAA